MSLSSPAHPISLIPRTACVHTQVSKHGFFLTASQDGYIKFWRKQEAGIEFAKQFKAHMGPVTGLLTAD